MKKTFFFLLPTVCIFLSSCKENEVKSFNETSSVKVKSKNNSDAKARTPVLTNEQYDFYNTATSNTWHSENSYGNDYDFLYFNAPNVGYVDGTIDISLFHHPQGGKPQLFNKRWNVPIAGNGNLYSGTYYSYAFIRQVDPNNPSGVVNNLASIIDLPYGLFEYLFGSKPDVQKKYLIEYDKLELYQGYKDGNGKIHFNYKASRIFELEASPIPNWNWSQVIPTSSKWNNTQGNQASTNLIYNHNWPL